LPHLGSLVGSTHHILGLTNGALNLSLRLLGNALDLERRIAGYPAGFLFDASYHFVDLTVHSIAIHLAHLRGYTSFDFEISTGMHFWCVDQKSSGFAFSKGGRMRFDLNSFIRDR
jgi:hypothetical protein